ncbi:MAG: hypothetical protein HC876_05955 [Chloroflexaceae bacterium]|nr:hypothetical protein [Chloroflexaceae bacterium]
MLGQRFLGTYPQMEWVRMTGHEIPFQHAMLPTGNGTVEASPVLLAQSLNDRAMATLDIVRDGDGFRVTDHRCGLMGMKPVKVTGSAFAGFDRDEYTTLAERPDRLLFIYLDVFWRYASTNQMLGTNHAHYIPAEQVRDVVLHTFHALVSMSIQHLIYEMGKTCLTVFPR